MQTKQVKGRYREIFTFLIDTILESHGYVVSYKPIEAFPVLFALSSL